MIKMACNPENHHDIIAFIPARGASKSIPQKNIKMFAGKPLIHWSLLAAQFTDKIEKIYVATDSQEIKQTVESLGLSKVQVVGRSAETAMDTASTESAMLEFARTHHFSTMILIQATSPLLTPRDLTDALQEYSRNVYDSMLSVVRQKRFIWDRDEKKSTFATNYDYKNRPRRQNFPGYLVENGAFYITTREGLLQSQNRLNGKIGLYEMPAYTYHEIDEQQDWIVMEALAKKTKNFYLAQWTEPIKVVALDVDGVLTDGTIHKSGFWEKPQKFSRVDGKGIELLKRNNLDVWVVSSEDSEIVRKRCEKLGITNVFLGVKDKLKCIEKLSGDNELNRTEICFIGDDVQDIPALEWVGFSAAPQNAVDNVKYRVNYLCSNYGGMGAVREVIDLILNFKQIERCRND